MGVFMTVMVCILMHALNCYSAISYCCLIGNVVASTEDGIIRHVNCSLLVESTSCCKQCKQYRNNSLLRQLNRLNENKENDRCSVSSHVNYRFLTSEQKDERLKRLHCELRKKVRQLEMLKKTVESLHDRSAVPLDPDTSQDLTNLMKSYSAIISADHPKDSFQYLFWKQQLDAAEKSNPKSIRWHPLMIKWCLYLHHKSSGAYKTLRESGILALPSGRTLRDYRHFAPAKAGFSKMYDKQLIDLAKANKQSELAEHIIVLVDEMYVKEGLVYSKSSGALTGFVQLDDVDTHLNELESSLQDSRKPRALAKTIVVFMVRGILSSLLFPYAAFPVNSLKAFNLFPLVWKVIGRLTRHGFRVWGITCDGASCNRKMFQMHDPAKVGVYKTVNFYSKDRHLIYFISDPPHLLKTVRNCFANSKRNLWVSTCTKGIYKHHIVLFIA